MSHLFKVRKILVIL